MRSKWWTHNSQTVADDVNTRVEQCKFKEEMIISEPARFNRICVSLLWQELSIVTSRVAICVAEARRCNNRVMPCLSNYLSLDDRWSSSDDQIRFQNVKFVNLPNLPTRKKKWIKFLCMKSHHFSFEPQMLEGSQKTEHKHDLSLSKRKHPEWFSSLNASAAGIQSQIMDVPSSCKSALSAMIKFRNSFLKLWQFVLVMCTTIKSVVKPNL